jgi:hypothetical protein
MIPETKKLAVTQALHSAFGVNEFDSLSPLDTGLSSALVFRMIVAGKPYLLKIFMPDALGDLAHQFNCMKPAAEAGIGPRIWYMSAEDRILITAFVEAKPFPIHEARLKLPYLLSACIPFPVPCPCEFHCICRRFDSKISRAKILPENIVKEVFNQYAKIPPLFPHENQDLVSCHNDLKPENILFDGRRAWIADWDAAF